DQSCMHCPHADRVRPPFPTRRASDLSLFDLIEALGDEEGAHAVAGEEGEARLEEVEPPQRRELVEHHEQLASAGVVLRMKVLGEDRKSTRLNSSHVKLSYAVCC